MILLHRLRATDFKQIQSIDIRFPADGTMLIEGRNEAGKSTVFEAIFFALYGKLPGGTDAPAKEARRYGTDKLVVTLDFSIEGRAFTIKRTQGENQKATLTFTGTGTGTSGDSQETLGLTAVNKQIVDEMHLSAQGLLNTCFVEQKKLEHLESLDSAKREETINELVNLSALTRMEKSLKSLLEERRAVEAARRRLDIATLDTKSAKLSAELSPLRPLESVARLAEIDASQSAAGGEIAERAGQQAGLAQVISLKETQNWLENELCPLLSLWKTEAETVDRAEQDAAKAEAARDAVPGLRENVTRLSTLLNAQTLWRNLSDEEARHSRWETDQESVRGEIARLTQATDKAEQGLVQAKSARATAEKFHALSEWARASRELGTALHPPLDPEIARLTAAVNKAEAERSQARREADDASSAANGAEKEARTLAERCRAEITSLQDAFDREIIVPVAVAPAPTGGHGLWAGIGVAAGVALAVAAFALHLPWLFVPAAFLAVGAILLGVRTRAQESAAVRHRAEGDTRRLQAQAAREKSREDLRATVARLQEESDRGQEAARTARDLAGQRGQEYSTVEIAVGRAENLLSAHRAAADRSGQIPGLREAMVRAEEQLRTLGQVLPGTPDAAESWAGTEPALSLAALRTNLEAAQTGREDAKNRLSAGEKSVVPYASRHRFTEEERGIALSAPKLLEGAGYTAADTGGDTGAGGDIADALDRAKIALGTAVSLAETLAARQSGHQSATGKARSAAAAFFACLTGKQPVSALFPKLSPVDTDSSTGEEAGALVVRLRENLRAREAGEDAALVSQTLSGLQQKNIQIGGEIIALRQTEENLYHAEIAPRAALHLPEITDKSLSELLPDLHKRFPEASGNTPAQWQEEIMAREKAIDETRTRRETLADTAQVMGTALDEAAEREAWEAATLAWDINNKAREILAQTRSAILDRILPGTQHLVKRILPLLTENRYREIKWDTKKNLVEVHDDRKGGLAVKKVFSGGTRDQISLALRLSFVLATLPSGKATRPGWLFLDEPLSSFDASRSESLIKLLTQGSLIRPHFPQIFLIAHGAVDPSRFDYHLVMEDGKVSPLSRMPPA